MAGYEFIRGEIVKDPPVGGDGPGAKGPIGSFNHGGGQQLVITYTKPSEPPEQHHIVPYLIGEARDKSGNNVKVLLAWKYGPIANPGKGFRCYKVDQITLPGSAPDPRPPLGNGATDRKKVKLKRQSCVDDW